MTVFLAILAALVLVFVIIRASLWLSDRNVGKRTKAASASGAGEIHDGPGSSRGGYDLCDVGGGSDCGGGGD